MGEQAGSSDGGASEGDWPCRPGAMDQGWTFLSWVTGKAILGKHFRKVVLMGPYWSGTNAVREEVLWRFHAPVLNPDKLEVCAPTPQAIQSLSDGLARGTLVRECIEVGKKRVPKGYRLQGGPHLNHSSGRFSSERRSRKPPSGQAATQAPEVPPREVPAQAPEAPPREAPDKPEEEEQKAEEALDAPLAEPAGPSQAGGRQSRQQAGGEAGALQEFLRVAEPPLSLRFIADTHGRCGWWKHAVRLREQGPMDTDDETLVVLVTKDPLFWLKSMSKHYYEMRISEGSQRAGLDALFGELQHEGRRYRDAVELWGACMGSFLDESLYPRSRCVLLRYEDFLFRFWDVMVHLSAFLPVNGQRLKESPNSSRSKSHGKEVRGREEALRFYSSRENRTCDFAPQHFERMRAVSPELLHALGYGVVPRLEDSGQVPTPLCVRCAWVPKLCVGDIVATRFRCNDQRCPGSAAGGLSCSCGSAWARVTDQEGDEGTASVELLKQVPCEWLVKNPHDWTVVEWPIERARGAAACSASGHARSWRQRVPREWIDLRMPCPRERPSHAFPLTEEGYRAVVSLRSTAKMADFIARVIAELEVGGVRAGRVLDRHKLMGFARWFSGEANVQCLAQIRRELPGKEAERWVTFMPPPPTRCLGPAMPAVQVEAGVAERP